MPLPQDASDAIRNLGDLSRTTGDMLARAKVLKEQRKTTHAALTRLRAIARNLLTTNSNSRETLTQIVSEIKQLATTARGSQEASLNQISVELKQALDDPTTEAQVKELSDGVNALIGEIERATGPPATRPPAVGGKRKKNRTRRGGYVWRSRSKSSSRKTGRTKSRTRTRNSKNR